MTDPVCPNTGAPMRRDTRPMTLTYKGDSITFGMPGWYCDASDESIHSGEDTKVSDRALNQLKARAEGLLGPGEIRRIRKKLGLSQSEAGELVGGGIRAFQKYESGDLLPSRAISSALVLLDYEPKSLAALRQRQVKAGNSQSHRLDRCAAEEAEDTLPLNLNWVHYRKLRRPIAGLYLLPLHSFENAPFLLGESTQLGVRIRTHKRSYEEGQYTFIRNKYFVSKTVSHVEFIRRWERVRSNSKLMQFIYVPERAPFDEAAMEEAGGFWDREFLNILICEVVTSGFQSKKAASKWLKRLELRVQRDIEAYYEFLIGHSLDFRIPSTRATLFGKRETRKDDSDLIPVQYCLEGRKFTNSIAFFQQLSRMGRENKPAEHP